ncbi:hypothetical protein CBS147326_5830 [Penicillium roqueforti]|nr:hypothetical protein CBS147326_5830 [Penicillium roqueforti]
MSNPENMRGNPNSKPQNSNTPASAPAPSPSTSTSNTSQPPPSPAPPSLATRIQTSATGLAKSAFQPSPDLAQTLASSTSSKQAGPPSLPSTQTSRDLSTTTPQHGGPSSSSGSAAQSFREPDTYTSTGGFGLPALTEDEFQNTYAYERETGLLGTTMTPTTTTYTNTTDTTHEDLQTKGKARAHDPTQHQLESVWQRQSHEPHSQDTYTSLTSPEDGSAVISLLSDVTFDPNFEDPATVPDTEVDIAAAPGPLSAAEREALDSFRKGMGLDGDDKGRVGRLTGASLVPDIDVFLSQGLGGNVSTSASTSLRDAVLTNLPGAGDWIGVQDRYHDEVWGFLQPVLEDARAEIEEKGEGLGPAEDGPAVRRLRMILMHMKG